MSPPFDSAQGDSRVGQCLLKYDTSLTILPSPDGSEKPARQKAIFCSRERATAGSYFGGLEKKIFAKQLAANSRIQLPKNIYKQSKSRVD